MLFPEGWSLFPGSTDAGKVLERRGALWSCAQEASLCGLEVQRHSLLAFWRRTREEQLMLLPGAIKLRMFRGATLAAQRWPCVLLVGGEAPDVCQAKECARRVRHLATAFLLVSGTVLPCPFLPTLLRPGARASAPGGPTKGL